MAPTPAQPRETAPPGPFRRSFWRSPIRGPWVTSVFGLALLASIPVMFVTGLLSYAAYNPDLSPFNDETPGKGWLGFYLFSWPTHPDWLYRLNQGVHVTLGLMLVPILLFKLWSVLPKLFEWPPLRSPAHLLERMSLFLLVGGAVFEFVTGILNIQTYYKFPGSFYPLHFYGAWVFIAGFVVHVPLKLPTMVRALRSRGFWAEMRTNLANTRPEPPRGQRTGQPGARRADDLPAGRARVRRRGLGPRRGAGRRPVPGRAAAPDRAARAARPGGRRARTAISRSTRRRPAAGVSAGRYRRVLAAHARERRRGQVKTSPC